MSQLTSRIFAARGRGVFFAGALAAVALLALTPHGHPQVTKALVRKDLRIPEYYDVKELKPGQANRFKALLAAEEAEPHLDGTATVKNMRIETYDPSGETNMIAFAPTCEVNLKQRTAWSPGRLEVRSGDGRMVIEGQGFFCQLTNATLMISNRVRTQIRKDAVPEDFRKP